MVHVVPGPGVKSAQAGFLDEQLCAKNKLLFLSQKASSQKRGKTSLTLTKDEAEHGQCPREDHLGCWGEIRKEAVHTKGP